jgi:hypothetical protein
MNRKEMLAQFSSLTRSDQILMLLLVSFNLTIVARDIFAKSSDQQKLKYATGVSEINHKILSTVITRLKEAGFSYPDEVLVEILYEFFSKYELEQYFCDIWEAAANKIHA